MRHPDQEEIILQLLSFGIFGWLIRSGRPWGLFRKGRIRLSPLLGRQVSAKRGFQLAAQEVNSGELSGLVDPFEILRVCGQFLQDGFDPAVIELAELLLYRRDNKTQDDVADAHAKGHGNEEALDRS